MERLNKAIETIKKYPEEILNFLEEGISVLSGGSILGALSGTSYSDYDVFTIKSPDKCYEYFTSLGFCDTSVTGYYLGYRFLVLKFVKNSIQVDVVLVNRGTKVNYKTPEDFIINEFDFDLLQVWYNGLELISPNIEKIIQLIEERKFSVVHCDKVRSRTTMKRIDKYISRGFTLVENDKYRELLGYL